MVRILESVGGRLESLMEVVVGMWNHWLRVVVLVGREFASIMITAQQLYAPTSRILQP